MVETAEIAVQVDTVEDYIAKRREYGRIHSKKYRETHKERERDRIRKYARLKMENNDSHFIQKIKEKNKKQYLKAKEKGITPEEKAKKAAYMKEYRARKKLERQNNQIV